MLLGLCKTEGHALERDDWAQKKLLDFPSPATDATEAEGVEPRLVKHSSQVPGRLTTQLDRCLRCPPSLVIHPPADRNITWVLLTQVHQVELENDMRHDIRPHGLCVISRAQAPAESRGSLHLNDSLFLFFHVLRRRQRGLSLTTAHHHCWCVYDYARDAKIAQHHLSTHMLRTNRRVESSKPQKLIQKVVHALLSNF